MPEITAAELNRFKRLELALEKARETAAKTKDENKQLGTDLRELEKLATSETGKVDQIVGENRGLAERLKNAETARDAALAAAETRIAAQQEIEARLKETVQQLEEATSKIKRLEQELAQLRTQVAATEAPARMMTAPHLGHLLDEFVAGVEQQAGGLQLTGGSLKLQIGLADTEAGPAFVMPSATTPADKLGPLHEVVMAFDRAPGAPTAGSDT